MRQHSRTAWDGVLEKRHSFPTEAGVNSRRAVQTSEMQIGGNFNLTHKRGGGAGCL
jgi:hypothetical protein